jgi:hypothetical protein
MSLRDVPIPFELILELKQIYPQHCIRPGEDYEEHLRYAGAAELVARLEDVYNVSYAPRDSKGIKPNLEMEF